MRHGHALSRQEAGVAADAERPLSARGEEEVLEAARHLRESGFEPGLIVSSPFLRASRTAEIAAGIFPSAERRTAAALSDGPAQAVLDLVRDISSEGGKVLVVGHQPLMGAIAGYFTGGEGFDLPPAGFVRLDPSAPRLIEFYTPPDKDDRR